MKLHCFLHHILQTKKLVFQFCALFCDFTNTDFILSDLWLHKLYCGIMVSLYFKCFSLYVSLYIVIKVNKKSAAIWCFIKRKYLNVFGT